MAFNESVLRQSLASLEGQRSLVSEPASIEKLEWSTGLPANGQRALPLPVGWIVEPSGPSTCPGVPPQNAVVAAFPPHDFTIVLRAAVWSGSDLVPNAAASACSSVRGPQGQASYASRGDWLGVSYVIEGIFIAAGPREVIQLEVMSPDQKRPLARALLGVWIKKVTE
jgi:hypothetical protein